MKKFILFFSLFSSVIFLAMGLVANATLLQGYQGGTGISTSTVGNNGNCLQQSSSSPFLTWTIATCGSGSVGSSTIVHGTSPIVVSALSLGNQTTSCPTCITTNASSVPNDILYYTNTSGNASSGDDNFSWSTSTQSLTIGTNPSTELQISPLSIANPGGNYVSFTGGLILNTVQAIEQPLILDSGTGSGNVTFDTSNITRNATDDQLFQDKNGTFAYTNDNVGEFTNNVGYITTSTNNFGGLTGNGTTTWIPVYNASQTFQGYAGFTFASSTGVLAAPTGTFTNLNITSITGTQCLHSVSGVVLGTGSDCGSGGGTGTVVTSTATSTGYFPVWVTSNGLGLTSSLYQNSTTGYVAVGTTTAPQNLTVAGNAEITAADGSKEYRYRTTGSALDFEGSAANLDFTVWSGNGFTGTQENYMGLAAGSHSLYANGNWQWQTGNDVFGHGNPPVFTINSDNGSNDGTVSNATSTFASSTILAGSVSSTEASALILAGSNGVWGPYGGASACSAGNAVTTISATGGTTCSAFLTGNQTITLSGDVTGSGTTAITATVARIQGKNVTSTAPTDHQILTYVNANSDWEPSTLTATSPLTIATSTASSTSLTIACATCGTGTVTTSSAGTANTLPIWTSVSALGNSVISQNGTTTFINASTTSLGTNTSTATSSLIWVSNYLGAGYWDATGTPMTVSSCGSSPSITGAMDRSRLIVGSGIVTSCSLTFPVAFKNTPSPIVSGETAISGLGYTETTSTLTITGTSLTGDAINISVEGVGE